VNHQHPGQSGLLVSETSCGNWLTHGSQVERDAAVACVWAALDEGITTFDTADPYAATRTEGRVRSTDLRDPSHAWCHRSPPPEGL
jgi:aryl-alcohol dehydrogenase-like predicted oxidoreductase